MTGEGQTGFRGGLGDPQSRRLTLQATSLWRRWTTSAESRATPAVYADVQRTPSFREAIARRWERDLGSGLPLQL